MLFLSFSVSSSPARDESATETPEHTPTKKEDSSFLGALFLPEPPLKKERPKAATVVLSGEEEKQFFPFLIKIFLLFRSTKIYFILLMS